MARALSVSRTAGVSEVLAAVYEARGYDGNKAAVSRILRHLPEGCTSADVTTALDAQVSASRLAVSSSKYGLTSTGLTYLRAHKPRGRILVG